MGRLHLWLMCLLCFNSPVRRVASVSLRGCLLNVICGFIPKHSAAQCVPSALAGRVRWMSTFTGLTPVRNPLAVTAAPRLSHSRAALSRTNTTILQISRLTVCTATRTSLTNIVWIVTNVVWPVTPLPAPPAERHLCPRGACSTTRRCIQVRGCSAVRSVACYSAVSAT